MEILEFVKDFLVQLAVRTPVLVFWVAVVIFAAVILRRGGGRAERFLIAGASLKIISNLLGIPVVFIPVWLASRGYSLDSAVAIASNCGIFINIIGMAGIICLVYAFWVKFKGRNTGAALQATAPES